MRTLEERLAGWGREDGKWELRRQMKEDTLEEWCTKKGWRIGDHHNNSSGRCGFNEAQADLKANLHMMGLTTLSHFSSLKWCLIHAVREADQRRLKPFQCERGSIHLLDYVFWSMCAFADRMTQRLGNNFDEIFSGWHLCPTSALLRNEWSMQLEQGSVALKRTLQWEWGHSLVGLCFRQCLLVYHKMSKRYEQISGHGGQTEEVIRLWSRILRKVFLNFLLKNYSQDNTFM